MSEFDRREVEEEAASRVQMSPYSFTPPIDMQQMPGKKVGGAVNEQWVNVLASNRPGQSENGALPFDEWKAAVSSSGGGDNNIPPLAPDNIGEDMRRLLTSGRGAEVQVMPPV